MNLSELIFISVALFVLPASVFLGIAIGGVFGGVIGGLLGLGLLAIVFQIIKGLSSVNEERIEQLIKEFNSERGLKSEHAWSESDIKAFEERLGADELKSARKTNKGADRKS